MILIYLAFCRKLWQECTIAKDVRDLRVLSHGGLSRTGRYICGENFPAFLPLWSYASTPYQFLDACGNGSEDMSILTAKVQCDLVFARNLDAGTVITRDDVWRLRKTPINFAESA